MTNLKAASASAVSYLEQIDRQSKFTQSGIDRLSTSSKGLSGAFQAAKKQSETLSNQLRTAQQKVELYQKGIDGLNTIIKRSKTEQESLAKQIDKVSGELKESEERLKAVRKEHGKESEEYQKAQKEASKYNESLLSLQSRYDYLSDEIKNSENKITEFQTSVNKTETEIKGLNSQLAWSRSKLAVFGSYAQEAGAKWEAAGKKISSVGSALTKGVTRPVATLGVEAFKAAADFETAFTGVTKTVDGTSQQMDTLRQGIIDMATDTQNAVPSTTTEIAAVAEAAGQLGIQTDNILKFSRTMIDLGNSTNLAAEEGASELAKFANITQMSQRDFDRLGSTIVDLGNKFATTEADIVAMGMRLAGAGTQIGLSQSEIMGFATALSSVGIEAEMGGSAFSKAMVKMQVACETGLEPVQKLSARTGLSLRELQLMSENASKDFTDLASSLGMTKSELQNTIDAGLSLENFADVAGVTAEQFKKAFEQDATQAIQLFINGLGDTETKGESTIQMLEEMGFTEVQLRDTMTRLANSGDLVTRAVDTGNKAWEENVALTNEANKRYQTTDSKLKIARNTIVDAGRSIGEQLLPVVADLAQDLSGLVKSFSNLPPETQKTILKLGLLSATAGPATKVIGGLTEGTGRLLKKLGDKAGYKVASAGISAVGSSATGATGGVSALAAGGKSLLATLAPYAAPAGVAVLAAGAIVGIGVAGYQAHKKLVEADLEGRFGKIALSTEEIEKMAGKLGSSPAVEQARTALEKVAETDKKFQDLSETLNTISSTTYSISVGMELDAEGTAELQQNVESFIAQGKEALGDRRLEVPIVMAGMSSDLIQKADTAFGEIEHLFDLQAQTLSEKYAKAVEDGEISAAEAVDISRVQQAMASTLSKATNAEYKATLQNLTLDYNFTPESYQNLLEKIDEETKSSFQALEDQEYQRRLKINTVYEMGGYSDEDYQQALTQSVQLLETQKINLELKGLDIKMQPALQAFQDQMPTVKRQIEESLSSSFRAGSDEFLINAETDIKDIFKDITNRYTDGFINMKIDDTARSSAMRTFEALKPTQTQLLEIERGCKEAGLAVPYNVSEGLNDIAQLGAIANDADSINYLIGQKFSEDPKYADVLKKAQEAGVAIPQALLDGFNKSKLKVTYATQVFMDDYGNQIDENGKIISSKFSTAAMQTMQTFKNTTTGQIMEVTPELRNQMRDLGFDLSKSFAQNLSDGASENLTVVRDTATGNITAFQDATTGAIVSATPGLLSLMEALGYDMNVKAGEALRRTGLEPPQVKNFEYAEDWAGKTASDIQKELNRDANVVRLVLETGNWSHSRGSGWNFKADGGIVNEPVIAGEAGPESIIPLSAAKRSRALELYAETGRLLGAESAFADFAVRGQWSAGGASLGAGDSLDRLLDKKIDQLSDKLLRVLMAAAPQVNITSPEPMSAAQVAAEFRRNQIRAAIRL